MCTHSTAWETSGRHRSCSLDEKRKILFVSFVFAIHFMVCIVWNPSFKLYSNPQDKNLIHNSNEGIFLWGPCSSYGRTEGENILICNFWSHSVLLLTLSLTDLCCAKPCWLLLFFVGIKKCCNGFLLPCHLSSLASFPPPEIHSFQIHLSKPVTCLFISFLKGTRFSNQPFVAFL